MEFYKYTPSSLGLNGIRLLRLLPGSPTADIEIKILHEYFSSNLEDEALSYAWGDGIPQGIIQYTSSTVLRFSAPSPEYKLARLDSSLGSSQNLAITKNLHVSFQYLRHWGKPRVIWIDAIYLYLDRPRTKYR